MASWTLRSLPPCDWRESAKEFFISIMKLRAETNFLLRKQSKQVTGKSAHGWKWVLEAVDFLILGKDFPGVSIKNPEKSGFTR